jgi:cytochrome c oxidase subunit 4
MADPHATPEATSGAHGHSHVGRYAAVWIALLAFTILTWALSRLHIPGGWGVLVALTIATIKGTLVALFFMHLWDQSGPNRLVFVTALVFVALLIGLTLLDNATRFPLANPPGSGGAMPVRGSDVGPVYRNPERPFGERR